MRVSSIMHCPLTYVVSVHLQSAVLSRSPSALTARAEAPLALEAAKRWALGASFAAITSCNEAQSF